MSGSKKYKNKTCVYCNDSLSTTADHVFPREFFPIEDRGMLPKVPACKKCNNEKSQLEHYLTTVLPFFATHSNSEKWLLESVPKRLNRNKKLQTQLLDSVVYKSIPTVSGYEQRMVLGFDYKKLHSFFEFVARGLVWHHFSQLLPISHSIMAFSPCSVSIQLVNRLLSLNTNLRANGKIGGDVSVYTGSMSEQDSGLSIWKFRLFGGFTAIDDLSGDVYHNSVVAVISAPKEKIEELQRDFIT